ncbi:MAG: sulfite exporter TauE/SafE family protein [Gemmataceae bacterium]|nr:sulfite exporter TauE/SafE family protein [Gemmataceae bacterium]MDW8267020.1 sulfite exporter TauE/SafE family protein [Gemmataceae bacterium]
MSWLLIFAGGLLGSGHCLGMCGSFVLALGSQRDRAWRLVRRQVVYGLGRVFTYAVGGAAAGYMGWRLASGLRSLAAVQACLAIAAGGLLLYQGLTAAGVLSPMRGRTSWGLCLLPSLFGALLHATRWRSVFLAGMVNGLLPCGLVYAYLSLAASSANLLVGALTMTLFGLGTVPPLALLGAGGQALRRVGPRLLPLAAWCVVLTGVLCLVRGCGLLAEWQFFQLPAEAMCGGPPGSWSLP